MNFALTPEQEQFRREVQAFLSSSEVQAIVRELHRAEPRDEVHPQQIYRWLGERGWLAANWPEEFGGLGKTAIEAAIVSEEMALAGVPDTVHVNTIDIVGTFLLLAGTTEQKRAFLPPMARGEMIVSVLYTEPGAGSDLSGLSTRAERSGDGYKLYGRKIYSLKSFMADYGLVAARTTAGVNPQAGITLFLVPLKAGDGPAEGVQIEPIWNITDERFNAITFDGAQVAADRIVGPLDNGWPLINAALALERTGLDYYAKVRRWLNLVIDHARTSGQLRDAHLGQRITALEAHVEAGRLMAWRIISQQARGGLDNVAASMSKWYNTEFARSLTRLALEMDGLESTLSRWDDEAPMGGLLEAAHREVPGLTLSAGTSEIMLHLISSAALQTRH
jgi:alkylation response protein AidB-like acyl-CoA dehydrogenase